MTTPTEPIDLASSASAAAEASALARWELENNARDAAAGAAAEAWFAHDADAERAQLQAKPWAQDPRYFKRVHISALALLKMAMHAKSGGDLEVMGMLAGRAAGDAFVVLDAFALPVVGTETRVNAQAEANEYMIDFLETNKLSGKQENLVGWYHSHPGYGCWLSGIDVGTQTIQQQYNEPFLAIVVDPHRTAAAGRVELGAFRAYPEGYTPPPSSSKKKNENSSSSSSTSQTIPLSKVKDFGVHADRYYALETDVFKSPLDAGVLGALWRRYWGAALAAAPMGSATTAALAAGAAGDVAGKLAACCEAAAAAVRSASSGGGGGGGGGSGDLGGFFGGGGFGFGPGGGGGGGVDFGGGGGSSSSSSSRRLARLMVGGGGDGGGGGGGIETPPSLLGGGGTGGGRAAAFNDDAADEAAAAVAAAVAADAAVAARAAKRPAGEEGKLSSAAADAARLATEQAKALASKAVRASLFGGGVGVGAVQQARSAAAAGGETGGGGGAAPMD